MRDDRLKSGQLQAVERVVHGRRNGEVRELDQEVVFLVQRVALGVEPYVLQIFKAEVEVAAGGDGEAAFEARLDFIAARSYQFGNEIVIRVGVRSADYVSNPIFDGHFSHGYGHIERFGAVIEA